MVADGKAHCDMIDKSTPKLKKQMFKMTGKTWVNLVLRWINPLRRRKISKPPRQTIKMKSSHPIHLNTLALDSDLPD